VAQADLDARRGPRDQRAGDAAVDAIADQLLRVLQAEGQADQLATGASVM
jgi:hypothetical protein